jgi:hypothetical protein
MKNITKLIPTLMAVRLVQENLPKKKEKKEKIVKQGVKNIVGLSLIGMTASMLSD